MNLMVKYIKFRKVRFILAALGLGLLLGMVVAMGGNALMTGDPDRPPVRCTLPTAYLHAGPEAATGIAMALWDRERRGRGQFVDVSMQETQLSTLVTSNSATKRSTVGIPSSSRSRKGAASTRSIRAKSR